MVEKNYDPDNENCPEKDTIEDLYSKINAEKNKIIQNVEEFTDENSNRVSNNKKLNKPDSNYHQNESDQ